MVQLRELIQPAPLEKCGERKFPVLSMTMHDGIILQSDRFKKSLASVDQSAYKVVKRNQLVVGFPIDEGVLYIQKAVDLGIMSPAYDVWDVDTNKVDLDYFELCLHSPQAMEFYKTNLRGTTARRRSLPKDTLLSLKILLPEMQKQKQIAETLYHIKQTILLYRQRISKFDTLIKARFVEMFDLEQCRWSTFGETTDFVDYRGKTPELSANGTIRMINAKSVGKGFFKYVDEFVTEEVYDSWMHRGFGYPGDVLFVTEGHTFGNACLVPAELKKFALGQRVITIKGQQGVLTNSFICSYMQTDRFWKDINVYRTGGTAQGIRSKDLVKVGIPLPSYDIQKRFASFVEQIDKSKAVVQAALDKAQLLFDSLMQQYFG